MAKDDSKLMTGRSKRPWYRLRWPTLLALCAVGVALLSAQLILHTVHRATNSNGVPEFLYIGRGWPIPTSIVYSTYPTYGQVQNTSPSAMKMALIAVLCYDQQGRWPRLTDVTYSLLLLVSTIFVCERRARGDLRNSQFGLKAAFAATCACAVVAMMWTNDFVIWNYGEPMHELVILHGCGQADFGWYVIAPMLFGITRMVFTVGWIIFWIAAQIIRRFSRRIATIKLGP